MDEIVKASIREDLFTVSIETHIGANRSAIIEAMGRLLLAAGFSIKGDLVIEDNSDCD